MAAWEYNASAGPESPAWNAVAVTPADGSDLATVATRGLYVGGAGDVAVYMSGGDGATAVVFVGVQAGTVLPIRVDRVRSTSTTATSILALY